jgi:hypothetical protein
MHAWPWKWYRLVYVKSGLWLYVAVLFVGCSVESGDPTSSVASHTELRVEPNVGPAFVRTVKQQGRAFGDCAEPYGLASVRTRLPPHGCLMAPLRGGGYLSPIKASKLIDCPVRRCPTALGMPGELPDRQAPDRTHPVDDRHTRWEDLAGECPAAGLGREEAQDRLVARGAADWAGQQRSLQPQRAWQGEVDGLRTRGGGGTPEMRNPSAPPRMTTAQEFTRNRAANRGCDGRPRHTTPPGPDGPLIPVPHDRAPRRNRSSYVGVVLSESRVYDGKTRTGVLGPRGRADCDGSERAAVFRGVPQGRPGQLLGTDGGWKGAHLRASGSARSSSQLARMPPPVDGEGHILPDVKVVDRFQIVQLLDRGTFGTVFRAWDPKWRQFVALKVVRKVEHYVQDAEFEVATPSLPPFPLFPPCASPSDSPILPPPLPLSPLPLSTTQVAILEEVAHLDVRSLYTVQLYKFFHYHGHLCIVTELLGESLHAMIKQHRLRRSPIRLSAIRVVASQVCETRDPKP